jgi:hypothetical protein
VGAGGSSIYHAFIKEQLAEQVARKNSLEQRGIAVITTSGTLASLLLGFAALVTASEDFSLSSTAQVLVVAAAISFAVAALAAVATNVPLLYASVQAEQMRALVHYKWADEQAMAEQRTAATLVKLIDTAKRLNRIKGWLLFAAIGLEALAVVLLAVAVVVILV